MAVFQVFQATAARKEDVLDLLTQESPDETPFLSRLSVSKANSPIHSWLTDSIASSTATGGSVVEGASAVSRTLSDRTRKTNYTQISEATIEVSGTAEATAMYGIEGEYAYRISQEMKRLKIIMDQVLLISTSATGDSATARTMTGLIDALQTNLCTGSAGVCALTQSMFDGLLQTIWEAGGHPDTVFCAGFNKRRISSFATSNTRYQEVGSEGRIRNFVSIYESDFGMQEVFLERYITKGTVAVLEMPKFKIAYLRRPFMQPLAVIGDSRRAQLLAEYTLEHLNEKSSGKFSAVATS